MYFETDLPMFIIAKICKGRGNVRETTKKSELLLVLLRKKGHIFTNSNVVHMRLADSVLRVLFDLYVLGKSIIRLGNIDKSNRNSIEVWVSENHVE